GPLRLSGLGQRRQAARRAKSRRRDIQPAGGLPLLGRRGRMKLASRDVGRFLQSAEKTTAAVLFYGPDLGLVAERAQELVKRVAGDPGDPFRVAELTAAQLKEDPRRLADEADALSLSGGRRILRLRQAGDGLASPLANLLKGGEPAAFLVLEAGELSARSTLR